MKYSLPDLAKRAGKRRSFGLPVTPVSPGQRADLAAIYLRVMKEWSGATASILAAYERALTTMGDAATVRDGADEVASTIEQAAAQVARLLLVLTPSLREWAFRVERTHRDRFRAAALSAAGVDLQTVIGPLDAQQTVQAAIAQNVELVRNVSEVTRSKISQSVFQGLNKRTPAREIAKQMNEAVGLGRKRSLRIASDQQSKITANLDQQRRRDAGIDQWKWRWSHKQNGRAAHAARDGKIYSDANPPPDMPAELPNCACKSQAFISLDDL